MSKREAEQFEDALRQASRGEAIEGRLASLVRTAQQAAVLAEPPPLPPRGLAPGRQRLLAEAVRRRAEAARRWPQRRPMARVAKLATALAAALLLFGLVFGVGGVMADSLPGAPLYGLELAGERVRLALTGDPQAKADLNLALAAERLDEIAALLQRGWTLDDPVANRAEQQLAVALETAAQLDGPAAVQELQRLSTAIQQREQTMQELLGASAAPPLRHLLREMERVRQEAQLGQGDPEGLRQRLRQGVPPEQTRPSGVPAGPSRTPQPSHTPGPQPSHTPGPQPSHTPEPQPSLSPTAPEPTQTPHHTPTPGATPGPTNTPPQGPGPGVTPGPTGTPPQGPGPEETPGPTGTPRQGPGPGETPGPTRPSGAPPQGPGPGVTPGPTDRPPQGPGPGVTPGPTRPSGEPPQGPGSGSTPTPEHTPGPGNDDPGHEGP